MTKDTNNSVHKKLSEMTLQELWALFPIFLVEHRERWKQDYAEMEARLAALLDGLPIERISHIGSTSINNIWAKNIVDILVEMPSFDIVKEASSILQKNGFSHMSSEGERISLNFGYTEEGFAEQVYHIHLRCSGDNDELYFRDYLREHPEIAKEYEELKLSLWKKYEHDRNAYTDAKTDFIRKWTTAAKRQYGARY